MGQKNQKYNLEKLFAVIGYPIKQSLSPILHNWAFEQFDMPNVYMKWEIGPDKLGELMVAVHTLPVSGLSVTIPFKEKIIPFLDKLTEEAAAIGAVNHVFWKDGSLLGNNTDVHGFIEPIKHLKIDSALILGTGGVSLACIYGLIKLGINQIWVAGRNLDRLTYLKRKFSIQPILWDKRESVQAQLLVNCTPLGMVGHNLEISPFPKHYLKNFSYVYDVVYNPIHTTLIKESRELGLETISGIYMFIYQALYQFETWTNKKFDVKQAYNLLIPYLQ